MHAPVDPIDLYRAMVPGEKRVYHQGFLAVDAKRNPAVKAEREAAWRAYEEGLVTLVQERIGSIFGRTKFAYIAIRRLP